MRHANGVTNKAACIVIDILNCCINHFDAGELNLPFYAPGYCAGSKRRWVVLSGVQNITQGFTKVNLHLSKSQDESQTTQQTAQQLTQCVCQCADKCAGIIGFAGRCLNRNVLEFEVGNLNQSLAETDIILAHLAGDCGEEPNAHLFADIYPAGLVYCHIGNHRLFRSNDFIVIPETCACRCISANLSTNHCSLKSQRRPVCTAKVNISEDDVVGVWGVSLTGSIINIQIRVDFACCLVDTAKVNSFIVSP